MLIIYYLFVITMTILATLEKVIIILSIIINLLSIKILNIKS